MASTWPTDKPTPAWAKLPRFFVLYSARREPGGGHKQMRLLAENIARLGFPCALLREDPTWDDAAYYGVELPYADFTFAQAAERLDASDVVLFPEYRLDRLLAAAKAWPGRKGVYAQGGFLAIRHRPRRGYLANGIEFVIAVSQYIAALAPRYLGAGPGRTHYVPYPIVRGPFAAPPVARERKRLAVAFMPRKLPDHVRVIRSLVSANFPNVPWVQIDGVAEEEVAARLDEVAIFLSTQNGEGFGLPAVEAMARGCVVAGYRGCGWFPPPYANRRNGLWARDRSVQGAAAQVIRAIEMINSGDTRVGRILVESWKTLEGYTPRRALEALRSALGVVMRSDHRPCGVAAFRLGLLGHLQALRTLQITLSARARSRE